VTPEPVRPEPQQAPAEPVQGNGHPAPHGESELVEQEPVQAVQAEETVVPEPEAAEPEEQANHIHAVSEASERRSEVPTPRRRVIFDDPDDLDVPEFLK